MDNELIKSCEAKAEAWLSSSVYDAATQAEVRKMLDNPDKTDLVESFYQNLEFGTGGLRGIMGVGTNRMNIYTVGAATQGLSNYLNKNFKDLKQIAVVVGHDCRNNSRLFAEVSANIFAANGIKVYLFDDMRPTPEMSFAIRQLGCQSGIILTASHNPKEYNGYKAYWDDGAQVLAPHDKGIIDEVNKVGAEGCDRSNHLIVAPHFRKAIAVAPAVATSFVTAKHGSIAVLLDLFLRMLRCPAIVQKLGIRSAGIQIAFIDASCGIVPLNILTGVPQGF